MPEQSGQTATKQRQEIAIFDTLSDAQAARTKLQEVGLSPQTINIDGESNVYERVSALGTTVGPEAGIVYGAFLGGTVGFMLMTVLATLTQGEIVNSSFNRLFILAFTIAGGVLGAVAGKQIRSAQLPEGKTKGNPSLPRRFSLSIEGDAESLSKAKETLGYPAS